MCIVVVVVVVVVAASTTAAAAAAVVVLLLFMPADLAQLACRVSLGIIKMAGPKFWHCLSGCPSYVAEPLCLRVHHSVDDCRRHNQMSG